MFVDCCDVVCHGRLGDRWGMIHQLTHLADAAAVRAEPRRAAILYDTLVEQTGALIFPVWQRRSDQCQAMAIDAAGLETFQADRFEGRQLDLDEVVTLAAGDQSSGWGG